MAAPPNRTPRVLLPVAPSEHTLFNRMNLPPFGAGVVTSQLRAGGVEVELHDLNSTFWRMWQCGEFRKVDLRPFYQEEAIVGYVQGGHHDELDDFAGRLLRGID